MEQFAKRLKYPFNKVRDEHRTGSVYESLSLTFVSDCEILRAELLVRDRVFDKILLSEGHEVPNIITQVVHNVSRVDFAASSTRGRRIGFP